MAFAVNIHHKYQVIIVYHTKHAEEQSQAAKPFRAERGGTQHWVTDAAAAHTSTFIPRMHTTKHCRPVLQLLSPLMTAPTPCLFQ
ncbi:hypothetical protein E2C01_095341 [Portunus trituberculatus]|uniref:Uncharacterized protein n=1 Tax=Portunus trituberculatus TaxID=210409 RepID=A0A5B7JZX8_PORTR|nr:hypothetical protein [Portunus trituberculatus]